jgi:hypothetical protein
LYILLALLPIQQRYEFFQHHDQQGKSKYSNYLQVLVVQGGPTYSNPIEVGLLSPILIVPLLFLLVERFGNNLIIDSAIYRSYSFVEHAVRHNREVQQI